MYFIVSASARISKVQGSRYQGFLRKRAGSSFGQKKGNLRHTMKNLKKFTDLVSIKCFPISFDTYKMLRWLPDGAGITNYQ
jgi:hypothetical protein